MLISFNWIKEFVKIPETLAVEEFAAQLTMLGLEVSELQHVNQPIPGVVVGEVMTKEKHPNADKLALTTIRYENDGKLETLPVICGAPNIAAGQKIAYAKIGTTLPNGMHIKKARIRGVESHGMVCSLQELGKEEISETIWVLPEEATLTDAVDKYGGAPDIIFDIEFTSNRSDAMSIIGVAREAAALLGAETETKVKYLDYLEKWNELKRATSKGTALKSLDIVVENSEDAPRYMALSVSGVEVKPSPRWLCDRLHSQGQRPINNIVDITNLIMLEYGQPLHAFDGGKLRGNAIVVRRAKSGETLITLDDRKVSLSERDLIIADKEKPIGLAGVMGGKESGISEATEEVIIEAAYFSSETVRETATRTGFDTEAAKRFMRGTVGIELTPQALCKAALLMIELGGGTLTSEIYDGLKELPKEISKEILLAPTIRLSASRIEKNLNIRLSETEITRFLERIGCAVKPVKVLTSSDKNEDKGKDKDKDDSAFEVTPPLFRKDLNYEWDLVEEIARLYGYDNIPVTLPRAQHDSPKMMDPLMDTAHATACALGYTEMMSYPFIEEAYFKASGEDLETLLVPSNPVISSASILRTSMLPGALKTLKLNYEKRNLLEGSFFECGHIFSKRTQQAPSPVKSQKKTATQNPFQEQERRVMGFLRFTPVREPSWNGQETGIDFYTLSGDLESFLQHLFPEHSIRKERLSEVETKNLPFLLHSESAMLTLAGKQVGYLGRVSEAVLKYFGFSATRPIYYGEIDLEFLTELKRSETVSTTYEAPSMYPFLTRDVALVVTEDTMLGNFIEDIEKTHECVERVALIEIYRGKELSEARAVETGKKQPVNTENTENAKDAEVSDTAVKSFVFRLQLRSKEKTLLSAEADRMVGHIVKKLARKYTFKLR